MTQIKEHGEQIGRCAWGPPMPLRDIRRPDAAIFCSHGAYTPRGNKKYAALACAIRTGDKPLSIGYAQAPTLMFSS